MDFSLPLVMRVSKPKSPFKINHGPLITDGRNSNEMFIFPMGLLQYHLGISKPMKISLPNLNNMDFRS